MQAIAVLCLLCSVKPIATKQQDAVNTTRIGFYQGKGTGVSDNTAFHSTLRTAAAAAFPSFTITNMTEADVAKIETFGSSDTAFHLVVFPGGSGKGQATAIGEEGIEALRNYVGSGGGYIGTCGGAFLGLQHVKFYGNGPKDLGPPTQEPWDRYFFVVCIVF